MDHHDAFGAVTDRGTTSVLVAAVLLLVTVLGVALIVGLGRLAAARAALQGAADAAALAAAPATFDPFGGPSDPKVAAERMASANGALLVACDCDLDPTWAPRVVVVEVARRVVVLGPFDPVVTARAAAEFTPVDLLR
jgi:uncharacterized membrane protein